MVTADSTTAGSEKNPESNKHTKELEKENAPQEATSRSDTHQQHPYRGSQGKILNPKPRHRAIQMAMEKFGASERFACQVLGQNRSALRKKKSPISIDEAQLRADPKAIASKYPARGWRKARWYLLATERWKVTVLNSKRIRRLWREESLVCKPKRRKKRRAGPDAGDQKRLTAEYPMHVLSFDFSAGSDLWRT